MLKLQIITSTQCPFCAAFLKRLSKIGFDEFDEYDADDPANKSQLDAWHITDMPIIQVVDEDGDEKFRFPYSSQGYSPRSMKYKRDELQKKEDTQ